MVSSARSRDSIDLSQGAASDSFKAVEGASAHERFERAGLTYEYFVDCLDASGSVQTVCDPATTDSAGVAVSWSGALNLPNYQASITRTGEWTLTGLQSNTAEFNGNGSFDIESHFQAIYRPVTKDLFLSYEANYDKIQIDMVNRQVVSGSISYAISGSREVMRGNATRSGEFSVTVDITFNAPGSASLVIDGSRSYTVDLNNGAVAAGL